jgi:Protein of unknown function (DUF3050)
LEKNGAAKQPINNSVLCFIVLLGACSNDNFYFLMSVIKTNSMDSRIEKIQASIDGLRKDVINHNVYTVIKDVESLKIFMEYHVYAVWDFMSLLKSLQNTLTCTSVPWFPKGAPDTRYFINEIVLGEESDTDMFGKRKSHFEMYLDAMKALGASTASIEIFISKMKETNHLQTAFYNANTPKEVMEFVDFTFSIISSRKPHLVSSVFTFGREELIPSMFAEIVNDIALNNQNTVSLFKYYLERHIEVDSNHHGKLSLQITENLCGNNLFAWQEAEDMAIKALQMRIRLWDGACSKIIENRY